MRHRKLIVFAALWLCGVVACAGAQEVSIRVDPRQPGKPVSRYLSGACIEDVNHEIYGGIYSQMIFGESFQEPPRGGPVKGFVAVDGEWSAKGGEVHSGGGPGPKLVSVVPAFSAGGVGVEVFMAGAAEGNAGLLVKVDRPKAGADNFDGYEVSLDAARGVVSLGRHRHDWNLLKEVKWDVPTDRWVALSAKLTERTVEVSVDGKTAIAFEDPDRPLRTGGVGLRNWQRPARYRRMWVDAGAGRVELPFESNEGKGAGPSGMWAPFHTGSAKVDADVEKDRPFVGGQSQRLAFTGGEGEAGIENQGLNRWGMSYVGGKPYEGYLWARAGKPAELFVALESRDGSRRYAEARLAVAGDEWRRFDFTLTPDATGPGGRFAVGLKAPGSVVLGHAFLQPGEWGRFKGLPVRKDVAEGLIEQGVTVLRHGGLMANAPEYRWKKMTGARDRRPPYKGHWYAYSSNGWGVIEFLNFCEAAGFLAVPDFNTDETPQDMADFVEYANGAADSEWGRRRAADGHPEPYNLRHVQIGNEERVDEAYAAKFAAIAEAMWAKDSNVIPVVGDFAYNSPIADPMKFTGADSRITSLAAHQKILALAKQHGREVWFDVHLWTDGPGPSPSVNAFPTYVTAIEKLAAGAKHKVVVFELNSGNHRQRRALANAWAINAIARDGRVPVVAAANCLQPDGQNDNGWDQGLLFLNPEKVWLQPPGYVTRMVSQGYQPRVLEASVEGGNGRLDVTATRSEDGKTLVLGVVNLDDNPRPARIRLEGYVPSKPTAVAEELLAPLQAANTAAHPGRVQPRRVEWRHEMKEGTAGYAFPPHSFTVLRFE